MSLTFRPLQDRDVPGLLALWEAAGWGTLDEATWRTWATTPHGPALVVVGLDGEDVVGQITFTPALLDAEGGPYTAARVAAPALHPSIRGGSTRSRSHPINRLFLAGVEAALAAGWDGIYTLPDRAWLPAFRVGVLADHFTTLAVEGARLDLGEPPPDGERAAESDGVTDAHAALWAGALRASPASCGIRRTTAWLRYRLGGHDLFDLRDGDGLRGYAAVRRSDGLVMDAVAASEADLAATFRGVARTLADRPDRPYPALKAMRTAPWRGALAEAGFTDDDYTFVVAAGSLSDRLPPSAADPASWYAVPAD